jgi:hypothetical protein
MIVKGTDGAFTCFSLTFGKSQTAPLKGALIGHEQIVEALKVVHGYVKPWSSRFV